MYVLITMMITINMQLEGGLGVNQAQPWSIVMNLIKEKVYGARFTWPEWWIDPN